MMVVAKSGFNISASAPTDKCFSSANGTKSPTTLPLNNSFLNLDQGDPTVFESFWRELNDECTVVIKGSDLLSYLSDTGNVCWFLLPELRDAVKRLHNVVGNAVTEKKHIVVGTGSTQLFQAALFALSSPDSPHPMNVVAAAPYYSEYKDEVEVVLSRLYKWSGDANVFDKDEAYIEVVTSPNNPDGTLRGPVVKSRAEGKLVYDFAYYWPQYTPITHKADHDIMLFTFSKCTGHAGSRIGWAIVKDIEVAEKMTRYIQMSSIGVSKESQTRVAKIMQVICDNYQNFGYAESKLFFQHSKRLMVKRWKKLNEAIKQSDVFTVAKSQRAYCHFTKELSETYPAFAWLKCKEGIEDCESYFRKLKIITRGGERFGADAKYARLSMLCKDEVFDEFLTRLSNIKWVSN
ncbi:hypothetical protein L6164_027283 [Bauhinia variegata]|uniref:Uncharacterized protein n=1 Tax=Bauhinia variegata TaxID=167791 RepID=A0ACB9LSX6_BAUVA|nr:hypothetical protein L6164_027283 [Bauhinia variegata]